MTTKTSQSLAWHFLRPAIIFAVLFLIVHVLGLRQYVAVLSGTGAFGILQRVGGAMYLGLYVVFVVCVPVLVIAAGLAKAVDACRGKREFASPRKGVGSDSD